MLQQKAGGLRLIDALVVLLLSVVVGGDAFAERASWRQRLPYLIDCRDLGLAAFGVEVLIALAVGLRSADLGLATFNALELEEHLVVIMIEFAR